MREAACINVDAIDRTDFNVQQRGKYRLITPRKTKHDWKPEEVHLRSLLVDEDGYVVSAGFPKFPNYGEWPALDEVFRTALARSSSLVSFADKLDGTLIIADRIDGKPHFRTRGSHNLGAFEEPVMTLIQEKYPLLLEFLEKHAAKEFSYLFEYTGPENRIVLRYDEPELTLLGMIDKSTLRPQFGSWILGIVSAATGIREARTYDLPTNPQELVRTVAEWKGREGVVARFFTDDGCPALIKIKADEYKRLHTLKFSIEGKGDKIAFLLDVQNEDDIFPKLAVFGMDYETYEFVKPEFLAYLEKRNQALDKLETFQAKTKQMVWDNWGPDAEDRKAYVKAVRDFLAKNPEYGSHYFHVAMRHYDGRMLDGLAIVFAYDVLKIGTNTVLAWMKDRESVLESLLNVTTDEDV